MMEEMTGLTSLKADLRLFRAAFPAFLAPLANLELLGWHNGMPD
jgi:hypothetical protein